MIVAKIGELEAVILIAAGGFAILRGAGAILLGVLEHRRREDS